MKWGCVTEGENNLFVAKINHLSESEGNFSGFDDQVAHDCFIEVF